MRFYRAARALTSWIAVVAVLMAALAPSISHALGTNDGATWVEICTAAGAKWVKAGGQIGDKSPVPSGAHALDHCPYCSLHADAIAIPAAPAATVPVLRPAHDLPIGFLAAPRTLHAWVSAQPRAPPSFS
jgi:hypothetical protein